MLRVKVLALSALAVLVLGTLATLVGPAIVQRFVDRAESGGTQGELIAYALSYLAIALLGGAARLGANSLGVWAGWRIADSLRSRLLRRILHEDPVLDVERRPVGEVLERVEGNADIIGRSITESGLSLLGNGAIVLGTLIVLFFKIPAAGLGIGVLLAVTFFVVRLLGRISVRRWKAARDAQAEVFGLVGDVLAARNDLVLLGESEWAVERIRRSLDELYRTERRAYISGRAYWPVTQLFVAAAFGLGFAFGLRGLELGTISIGTITAIYLYFDLLQKPLEEMSSQAGQLQQMMAVLAMTAQSLAARPPPNQSSEPLPARALSVAFDGVTFGYDGSAPVLHDVSFVVAAGRRLGIVGRTGAGKSTIVNLLCGLVRPTRGRVLIGGVDAHRIPVDAFARQVTVLSQRSHVFSASVRDNVTLFREEIDERQIWDVLERLDAARWVRDLPQGLDTPIGTGGRTLSVGEQQLLIGARALLRPGNLLIIDEGTSQMDAQTEQSWAKLIEAVSPGRTVIMVEHRKAALGQVDEVLRMENGRVAELRARSSTTA
ncbi:ABC transporter ATP-binding protein [Sorangium sp. So ce1335]|uniref:ABC transporter ATP-binding protein n=1 Tax=Sorangium sp. So ce1335 TaxID=3133335 RepID=UPI003F5DEE20